MTTYQTIDEPTEGYFKDRGSRFLAFAFPVASLEEIRSQLSDVRKAYHDARHHCYGYILGMKDLQVRANDDGEPSHSAGDPILGQIKSAGLTNTLVVVVRYFGGTKLGVAGLINAYKTAASEALVRATTREIFPEVKFKLLFDYEQTNEAERLLASLPLTILDRVFTNDCEVIATIHEDLYEQVLLAVAAPSKMKIEALNESPDSTGSQR